MADLRQFSNWHSPVLRQNTSSSLKTTSKIFNLLTVCVAATALLAPTQGAFAATRQINSEEAQHLMCVKQGQHLLCDVEANTKQELAASPSSQEDQLNQSLTSSKVQPWTDSQQGMIANQLLWLSYLLPVGLLLRVFLSERYSDYRESVLNKHIKTLEKLWKQHSTEP